MTTDFKDILQATARALNMRHGSDVTEIPVVAAGVMRALSAANDLLAKSNAAEWPLPKDREWRFRIESRCPWCIFVEGEALLWQEEPNGIVQSDARGVWASDEETALITARNNEYLAKTS